MGVKVSPSFPDYENDPRDLCEHLILIWYSKRIVCVVWLSCCRYHATTLTLTFSFLQPRLADYWGRCLNLRLCFVRQVHTGWVKSVFLSNSLTWSEYDAEVSMQHQPSELERLFFISHFINID